MAGAIEVNKKGPTPVIFHEILSPTEANDQPRIRPIPKSIGHSIWSATESIERGRRR